MDKIQICSVSPEGFRLERPSYNFSAHLDPCLPPQEYTSVWVTDMQDMKVIHIGGAWTSDHDIERIPVPIPAKEIVADFFRAEDMKNKGCFVPKGDKPTEKELETAHETRNAWLLKNVEDGEKLYGQHGPAGIPMIPDYFKRSAKELGLTPAWVVAMKSRQQECPACGDTIKAGVVICKSCGAILDAKRAQEFGLVEEKNKGGRPKKEEVAA